MTTDASGAPAPPAALLAARLAAHGLDGGFPSAAAALDRLVCVQAQDLAAAKWVLGARVPGLDEAALDRAIAEGSVLRSWPMRGTLHFVAPAMLRPILRLTAARQLQRAAKTHRDEGIDDEVTAAARRTAVALLEGGRSASRDELQRAWGEAGIPIAGQRGYHLLWRLAVEGLLCPGPVETRARQRFVLLDEWSPRSADEPVSDDETLATLFTAYARGHGPVTVRDFAWWTGLTLTSARTALAAAADAIVSFDEQRYVAADAAPVPRGPAGRHVLAPFDEYFLGYGDRTAFCSADDALKVVPGKNGLFLPVLVEDGRVVGTWRRSPERRGITDVELSPFGAGLDPAAFRPALERWAAFWPTRLGEVALAG
ncbi:winged helix DNA-binding domain-containing protein [Agromyces soli]